MRFAGRGHPAIRATHGKTLELARDDEITERATCVIAVGARPERAQPMAGPVRITIRAGGHEFGFDADANSSWSSDQPAVIRRGPLFAPPTFATNSTAGADDLPRSLVEALRYEASEVEVVVEKRPSPPTLVLARVDRGVPPDLHLIAELDAADAVVSESAAASAHLGCRTETPLRVPIEGRVLVLSSEWLPGRRVPRMGVPVETFGLHPSLAAAAAAPWFGPLVISDEGNADWAGLLRSTPASHRLVLRSGPDTTALFSAAAAIRGSTVATVAQEFGHPRVVGMHETRPFPGAEPVWCCLGPGPDGDGLDPLVRKAIDALLAGGVPTKTAATTLATLAGWDRRRAYDAVLGWRRSLPDLDAPGDA